MEKIKYYDRNDDLFLKEDEPNTIINYLDDEEFEETCKMGEIHIQNFPEFGSDGEDIKLIICIDFYILKIVGSNCYYIRETKTPYRDVMEEYVNCTDDEKIINHTLDSDQAKQVQTMMI